MGMCLYQIFKSQRSSQVVTACCSAVRVKPVPSSPGAGAAPGNLAGAVVVQLVTSVLS